MSLRRIIAIFSFIIYCGTLAYFSDKNIYVTALMLHLTSSATLLATFFSKISSQSDEIYQLKKDVVSEKSTNVELNNKITELNKETKKQAIEIQKLENKDRNFAKQLISQIEEVNIPHIPVLYKATFTQEGKPTYTVLAECSIESLYRKETKSIEPYGYRLHRIMWKNGGSISFIPRNEEERAKVRNHIFLEKECTCVSIYGKPYTVKLLNEDPLPYWDKKLSERIAEQTKNFKMNLKKLVETSEEAYPYYSKLLADAENKAMDKLIGYYSEQPRAQVKYSEILKTLNKKLKSARKTSKELEYLLEIHYSFHPELKELKGKSTKEIEKIRNRILNSRQAD